MFCPWFPRVCFLFGASLPLWSTLLFGRWVSCCFNQKLHQASFCSFPGLPPPSCGSDCKDARAWKPDARRPWLSQVSRDVAQSINLGRAFGKFRKSTTVGILAQGTSWVDAAAPAFLPQGGFRKRGHPTSEPAPDCGSNLSQKFSTLPDLCVSSLRRGHANLLCIVPI